MKLNCRDYDVFSYTIERKDFTLKEKIKKNLKK